MAIAPADLDDTEKISMETHFWGYRQDHQEFVVFSAWDLPRALELQMFRQRHAVGKTDGDLGGTGGRQDGSDMAGRAR